MPLRLNLRIVLPVLLALAAAAGCGKKTAPEPPLTNSRLVLQIFAALREKSHETAYNQISRLAAIEKNDVFLGALKNNELANLHIEKIQAMLDQLQFDTARTTLDKAMINYGRSKTFLDALAAVDTLTRVQAIAPRMEYPTSGEQLEKDAAETVKLLEKLPGSGPYLAMAREKIEQGKAMQLTENERAVFSLYAEIVRLRRSGQDLMADVLTAELGALSPTPAQLRLAEQLESDTAAGGSR